jgi:hypothetical protein
MTPYSEKLKAFTQMELWAEHQRLGEISTQLFYEEPRRHRARSKLSQVIKEFERRKKLKTGRSKINK